MEGRRQGGGTDTRFIPEVPEVTLGPPGFQL